MAIRDCDYAKPSRSVSPALPHGLSFNPRPQSRRSWSAISAGVHALIVVLRKVAQAMTPVGCRPSVRGSGSIFCHHPVQPIYVPQCNVCPWKRTGDAGFVKGIEDGDPQIGACANAVVKVDKRIELEFETVRPERFELDRRRRRRCDVRIALRNV